MSKRSIKNEQVLASIVRFYRKLAEFGFVESYPERSSSRLKEVRCASPLFIMEYGIDLCWEEMYGHWIDAVTGLYLPSYMDVLCYFLPDMDILVNRHDATTNLEENLALKLDLYRENPWVIQSNAWTRDPGFLLAIKKTEQWSAERMQDTESERLKPWEYQRVLRSFRSLDVQLPFDVDSQ